MQPPPGLLSQKFPAVPFLRASQTLPAVPFLRVSRSLPVIRSQKASPISPAILFRKSPFFLLPGSPVFQPLLSSVLQSPLSSGALPVFRSGFEEEA